MERKGENGKMQVVPATNSTTHLPVRPAGARFFSGRARTPDSFGGDGPGYARRVPLAVTSCRPAYGDSPPGGHEGRVMEGRG